MRLPSTSIFAAAGTRAWPFSETNCSRAFMFLTHLSDVFIVKRLIQINIFWRKLQTAINTGLAGAPDWATVEEDNFPAARLFSVSCQLYIAA